MLKTNQTSKGKRNTRCEIERKSYRFCISAQLIIKDRKIRK